MATTLNVFVGVVQREIPGQGQHRSLAGGVRRHQLLGLKPLSTRIVDDDAPAAFEHLRNGVLAEQKATLGVHIHDAVPDRFVQMLGRSVAVRRLYADVVEENIDAAKRCDGLLNDVARFARSERRRLE